ncbi:alanine/ornithine racemase family PLP-dependent enzyme [Tissierella sp. MB52-C2]|uniref:alanine/ornithine racemase family PLP-dependent enzyme n=1 Tax=Tissierella sp. MB52-C2 TaxID=3070999 RepID=UPI00280B74FA|nr:alanine/ornithine racemase family PLP-dependent enzyme [Tissierella sp. MB52-C2]WMM23310.1 alanine/ornithine racemase family PLP-dependent enzyme [Tissierella sp. MB52-C2]
MQLPSIYVDTKKIQKNAELVVNICKKSGIEVMGITKGICAFIPAVKAMLDGGVPKLGDSRMSNIISMRDAGIDVPIYLIRIPMMAEVENVIKFTYGSLNSELTVIKALSEKAVILNKVHKVILMVDVGDLREGVLPEDVLDIVENILELPNIELEGLGTNVGCYGGVLPSYENTKILVDLAIKIESKYKIQLKTLSGGSTVNLDLLDNRKMASGINQLRIGEAILLGTDIKTLKPIPGAEVNTIVLKTQVIELKIKPSHPIGEIGRDAFGKAVNFQDRGNRKRAIIALGKQDCGLDGISPIDSSIEILGASSDHMILDVTDCKQEIQVGSIIEFNIDYGGMLDLTTSKYVGKS